eukprot:4511592-Pyramimonas_sp.AAC.1
MGEDDFEEHQSLEMDDENDEEERSQARCRLTRFLFDNISYHTCLPTHLAVDHRDLPHKCAAATYVHSLECSTRCDLIRMQSSFVSMTTDLGTEVGMAQFYQQSLDSLLPDWMRDVMERDVESEGADDRDLNVEGSWMPKGMVIPGMLHVMSNLSKEVGLHLRGWDDFWKQLSNIEELLCKQDNKDKFIRELLLPSPLAQRSDDFEHSFTAMYDKRWGVVVNFMVELRKVLHTIRAVWNERVWLESRNREDSTTFNPSLLTSTLGSSKFYGYFNMQLSVHYTLKRLTSWLEGCDCHKHLYKRGGRVSAQDRQREFGSSDPYASCPLKGLRGPALAAGDHFKVLQDLAQVSEDRLEQKDRIFLRLEDWEEVVGDMNTLIAAIDAILRAKTSCWGTLPHILVGLSHPDEEKARSCAVKAVDLWESTPADARATLDE